MKKIPKSMIFSLIEVCGVGVTAYVAYQTGKRVQKKIEQGATFKDIWLDLIPVYGAAAGTIAVIFMNEKLNQKQKAELVATIAAMSSVGAIPQKNDDPIFNPPEVQGPDDKDEIESTSNLKGRRILCKDDRFGRWFYSSEEDVSDAIYNYISELRTFKESSYNKFYRNLGLSATGVGQEFGDIVDEHPGDPDLSTGNVDLDLPIWDCVRSVVKDGPHKNEECLTIYRLQPPMDFWYDY